MKEALRVEKISVYYPCAVGIFPCFRLFESSPECFLLFGRRRNFGGNRGIGCGKSTLAQALVGLLPWHSGTYSVFGKEVDVNSAKAIAQVRKSVQMVFQDPYSSLNPRQTIAQILTYPLIARGTSKSEALEKAKKELDLVGLPNDSLSRYPHEFSEASVSASELPAL